MKILLDENLPDSLKPLLSDLFEVVTISQMGWQSKQNGELLRLIDESEIDLLLTADKNLQYQQNLNQFKLQVAVILSFDNRANTFSENIQKIREKLTKIDPKEKVIVIDIRNIH